MKIRLSTITMLLAATLTGGAALAQANDPEGYADGYQDGTYGRIRYSEGGATILRADGETEGRDRSGVNAPIFPGDTVQTSGDQRAEIQLSAGTLVRLDRGTEMVFQSMPDPYAKYQDNVVLVLRAGAVRIGARLTDKEEFRVDTASGSVYLLGDGDFRIESDGRVTSVASLRGVAEVVGADGSVLVRGGSRTVVAAGAVPDEPRTYSAFASDGFDRWCENRDAAYRDHVDTADAGSYDDVPSEVRPYYNELSSYGSWTVVPEYGRVWYPSGVYAGWRPYYDGYWAYGPGGYFWVSSEPWGWAPYRYGSWQYVGSYGWCWVPGRVFAGAWVSWSWGSAYFGWAPLDYYGYPCWRTGGYYRYGYYDPDCWTFVNYNNAYVTNVRRYAVPVNTVRSDLRNAQIVTRAPRVAPSRLAQSREARESALRSVASDRAAIMRSTPVQGSARRSLADMQNEVLRRSPRATNPSVDRFRERIDASPTRNREPERTMPQRGTPQENRFPRRLTADPRGNGTSQRSVAPKSDARDNVRGLYERMSRPRETRGSDDATPQQRVEPRGQQQRVEPRAQAQQQRVEPRAQSQQQRVEPRGQQQRVQPRAQQPQSRAPQRMEAPRPQTQRAQPQRSAPRPSQGQGRSQPRPAQPQKSKDSSKSNGGGGHKR